MKKGFDPDYKYQSNFTLAMMSLQKGSPIKKWMRHDPDITNEAFGKSDLTIAMMMVKNKL